MDTRLTGETLRQKIFALHAEAENHRATEQVLAKGCGYYTVTESNGIYVSDDNMIDFYIAVLNIGATSLNDRMNHA